MIKLTNVSKTFGAGNTALSNINFTVDPGEFVFLVGPSGSGKTTLFRLLIREMIPSEGSILFHDVDLVNLPKKFIPHLRKRIGVVFQDLKLLRDRTIFENILFPLEVADMNEQEAITRTEEILTQVGIIEHKDKFPIQLSGGELQRAAIARALVFSPEMILADEPTGDLDNETSWEIVKLLQDINKSGTTIIMATHNTDIVNSLLKRVLTLEKGSLVKDETRGEKKHSVHHEKKNVKPDAEAEKPEKK